MDARGALGAVHVLGPIDTGFWDEDLSVIALDRAGDATVVWLTAPSWGANSVLARRIGADETLDPLWTLAERGGAEPDVAVNPAGNATAAWVGMTPYGYSAILSRGMTRKDTRQDANGRVPPQGDLVRSESGRGRPRRCDGRRTDVLDRRYPQALIGVARLVPRAKRASRAGATR